MMYTHLKIGLHHQTISFCRLGGNGKETNFCRDFDKKGQSTCTKQENISITNAVQTKESVGDKNLSN